MATAPEKDIDTVYETVMDLHKVVMERKNGKR